jgi:4-amino-4-deoxy-L-arabinose transferase-like glycosyltransferase
LAIGQLMTTASGASAQSPGSRVRPGLLLVLFFALALRIAGIGYGLPHLFHADEALEVFRALRLGTGGIDLELNRALKGGLFYLLFAEYGVYTLAAMAIGKFASPEDLGRLLANDPSPLWLMGRATVALFGTATVALVWRWLRPRPTALFSAALLAFSFMHVKESQLIGLEVPLGFLALLLILFLRDLSVSSNRGSWLSGAIFGLAAMTKITGAALLLPLVFAHGMLDLPLRRRTGRLMQAVGVATLVYVVGNPGIWVNAKEILGFLGGSFSGGRAPDLFQLAMLGGRRGPVFYLEALQLAFGWVGAALALLGIFVASRPQWLSRHKAEMREKRGAVLLVSFALPYLLVLAASQTVAVHRYIVPVLPVLAILAGLGLEALLRQSLGLVRTLADVRALSVFPLGGAIALAVLVEPAMRTLRWDSEVLRDDTRLAALRWIEAHVANGAGILLAGNRTFPAAQTAPIPVAADHLVAQLDFYARTDEGKAHYLREFAIPACARRRGPAYHPHYIDPCSSPQDLAAYREAGVEWAVLTSRIADGYSSGDAWRLAPRTAALYADLRTAGRVVARFRPESWRRAGPTITVLQLDPLSRGAMVADGEGRRR